LYHPPEKKRGAIFLPLLDNPVFTSTYKIF